MGLIKTYEQTMTFSLQAEDIDRFSEWVDELSQKAKVEPQNRMRVRLLTEEVLLRACEQFGEQTEVVAIFEVPLRRPRLRLEIAGEPFNPLGAEDRELGGWASSLRTAIGIASSYSYEHDKNVLRFRIPYPGMNPVAVIGIALALGAFLGFVGNAATSDQLAKLISDILLTTTYGAWIRVLNAISAPIIFLTVATTMLNTHRIDEKGGSSLLVIARYFIYSILVVVIALVYCLPLLPLERSRTVMDQQLVQGLIDATISAIPANIVDPFAESNTAQLLLLAFVLGALLIQLGDSVPSLKRFVREANIVGLQLARSVSFFVPLFAGTFVCLEILDGKEHVLYGIWQPLCLALLISSLILLAQVLYICLKLRVKPLVFIKKVRKPFTLCLKTGSQDSSFGEAQRSCTRLLGINKDYVKEALPQGLVLYMPISAVGTIIFTLYAAQAFGLQVNMVWYVSAVIMAVFVFVATPPVPGANLLAYVVLFAALGIPETALRDAMIFDIVFGIFAAAANQAMLQFEMLLQANRFALLDVERLRKPVAKR